MIEPERCSRCCHACGTPIPEGEGYDGEPDVCSRECAIEEEQLNGAADWAVLQRED